MAEPRPLAATDPEEKTASRCPAACQARSAGGTSGKKWAVSSPAANPSAQIRPCNVLSGVALTSPSIHPCSTSTASAVPPAPIPARTARTSGSSRWASRCGPSRGRA
ncbi:hypothetical protein ACFQ0B_54705 [Nonomuraea thailandensis]